MRRVLTGYTVIKTVMGLLGTDTGQYISDTDSARETAPYDLKQVFAGNRFRVIGNDHGITGFISIEMHRKHAA